MDRRGRAATTRQASSVAVAPMRSSQASFRLAIPAILTVEMAAYVAIVVLGFVIRIGRLDAYPLGPDEAARALSGWQLIRGLSPDFWQEPLVILSAAVPLFALGDNDLMARLPAVAAGSALVSLPWLLRGYTGRTGALLASLFLAISPTFVFYSRTLSGDVLAAALSLGLMACIVRYVSERRAYWAIVAAGLIALLLNAGAAGITSLLIFTAFFALIAAVGKASNEYMQALRSLNADREALKNAGIVLLGGFVMVGTVFLSNLSGLKLPALSAWVGEFNLVADSRPWYYHLEMLLAYEPLIFVFGVAGAAYYLYQWQKSLGRQPLGIKGLLIFWAAAGLLAASFTGVKHGGQLLGPALPLAILAGTLVSELLEKVSIQLPRNVQGMLAGALPFLVYIVLTISDLTRKDQLAGWDQWILVILALGLVVALLAAGIAYGGRRAGHIAALSAVVLLIVASVHITWRTAYFAAKDEPLLAVQTSVSLADAVDEIEEYAYALFLGKAVKIAVEPTLSLPVEWYLRNYSAVQYTAQPASGVEVIIWQTEKPPDEIKLQDYFTRKAKVTSKWSGAGGTMRQMWRWIMYGEPFGESKTAEIMLYFRKT